MQFWIMSMRYLEAANKCDAVKPELKMSGEHIHKLKWIAAFIYLVVMAVINAVEILATPDPQTQLAEFITWHEKTALYLRLGGFFLWISMFGGSTVVSIHSLHKIHFCIQRISYANFGQELINRNNFYLHASLLIIQFMTVVVNLDFILLTLVRTPQ